MEVYFWDRKTGLFVYTGSMKEEQAKIRLTYRTPVLAYDGVTTPMKRDGSFNILFYQNRSKGDVLDVDVVAAVTVPNRQAWEVLKNFIDEHLEETSKTEP
jgi:hypothetical protein